jgi:hypothetical protein
MGGGRWTKHLDRKSQEFHRAGNTRECRVYHLPGSVEELGSAVPIHDAGPDGIE